ncbi:hypothetical protein KBY99_13695 [Cyanobium sp. Maggiore-St4-Cus]|uniref:hypothetical protein n=1 Tax=Cyanobium sp. Maggiore-St4-Cus TaxID=2823717 RepID=UPI0020CE9790|nr:hypothetical protein [Cyanobium sp. Maggiore-St4-Cus]MCP9790017.1 hypothetical protein [Cyanobium sp. Maggiore-St4-Cus]
MGLEQVAGGEPAPLSPEPRRQEPVAVLAIEQLGRHCRQPSLRVPGAGYVLRVGSVHRLRHLDAEAGTI